MNRETERRIDWKNGKGSLYGKISYTVSFSTVHSNGVLFLPGYFAGTMWVNRMGAGLKEQPGSIRTGVSDGEYASSFPGAAGGTAA